MAPRAALKTAAWLARLILGGTFAYAGAIKALDPRAFVADIGHYHLLPYPLAVATGVYLPWLELLAALAVLTRRAERGALLLLTALCAVFTLALASALFRGLDVDCGCFGAATSVSIPIALVRTLALGLIAGTLFHYSARRSAVKS